MDLRPNPMWQWCLDAAVLVQWGSAEGAGRWKVNTHLITFLHQWLLIGETSTVITSSFLPQLTNQIKVSQCFLPYAVLWCLLSSYGWQRNLWHESVANTVRDSELHTCSWLNTMKTSRALHINSWHWYVCPFHMGDGHCFSMGCQDALGMISFSCCSFPLCPNAPFLCLSLSAVAQYLVCTIWDL